MTYFTVEYECTLSKTENGFVIYTDFFPRRHCRQHQPPALGDEFLCEFPHLLLHGQEVQESFAQVVQKCEKEDCRLLRLLLRQILRLEVVEGRTKKFEREDNMNGGGDNNNNNNI
jgi:hypothetical protein